MEKIWITAIMIPFIALIIGGCEKSEIPSDYDVEGIYIGSITNLGSKNGAALKFSSVEATAEVHRTGNSMIEVHMFNTEMDTLFMLNFYDHADKVMVCFTGQDFENAYGYPLGQEHHGDGMMGDIGSNETEWMHHLNEAHNEGDEHFGEFNNEMHSFTYAFERMEGSMKHDLLFNGVKQ